MYIFRSKNMAEVQAFIDENSALVDKKTIIRNVPKSGSLCSLFILLYKYE